MLQHAFTCLSGPVNVVTLHTKAASGELRDENIVIFNVHVQTPKIVLFCSWQMPAKIQQDHTDLCFGEGCFSHFECSVQLWDGHCVQVFGPVVDAKGEHHFFHRHGNWCFGQNALSMCKCSPWVAVHLDVFVGESRDFG